MQTLSWVHPALRRLFGLVLGALIMAVFTASGAEPAGRPNLILILADDLGYGDLGCYGQDKIKTPNLDKIAAEGIRFTSAYAGSTVCAPSRCALMTGLHTGHALIRGNARDQNLGPADRTLAEVLKQSGYTTGLIGKWGLGEEGSSGVPGKKGFDQFFGFLNQTHAHDYYTDHLFRFDGAEGFEGRMDFDENQKGKKKLYVHDQFAEAALNFVKLNAKPGDAKRRPFFLFLAFTIPHANNEEGRRTGNGMQVPTDAPYTQESWPQVQKNKAAMISRMDHHIGKLMELLKALKIDENTIVLFSSDNGPHKEGGVDPEFFKSSGPWRGIKRDLYEGGIRVPLLVRWPGTIAPGRVSDLPCAFWDILPTASEIAGVPAPGKLDGISILPTLLGRPQTRQHDFLYWEFHENGFQQAARMGDWKAVRLEPDQPLELYNLKSDAGEKTNVADKNPEVATKLADYLKGARSESERWPIRKKNAKAQGAGTN
jgi:arylsulfatase A-like enzyme